MFVPLKETISVNIGEESDNWMSAVSFVVYCECYLDFEITQGKWYAGVTKAEATRIDITTDNIGLRERRDDLLLRAQEWIPGWINYLNEQYFSLGSDLPEWVPDYMEFETYYRKGALFVEVDFDL